MKKEEKLNENQAVNSGLIRGRKNGCGINFPEFILHLLKPMKALCYF